MLSQIPMFGNDKISNAIELARMYEPIALDMHPDGYYLAYSGGKDSDAAEQILIMAGVKYTKRHNLTTDDAPETIRHIRKHHPDCIFNYPDQTMWDLVVRKRRPPSRIVRYCCGEQKEVGGEGRFVVTGVRWDESRNRLKNRAALEILKSNVKNKIMFYSDNEESRRIIENCAIKGKRILNIIIDFTTEEVWELLKMRRVIWNPLYDEGFDRIGCVMCPVASTKQMLFEAARWPKYQNIWYRTFDRMIEAKKAHGDFDSRRWKTASDTMDWFIYQSHTDPNQLLLEDEAI